MNEAGKGVSPSPSLSGQAQLTKHSSFLAPQTPTFSLSRLQPAFPPSDQPPIPSSLTLSFTYSIISTDVL